MAATATIEVTVELDTTDPEVAQQIAIDYADALDAVVAQMTTGASGVPVTSTRAEASRVLTYRTTAA